MTDMSAVADASVDAIFSSHNIEHLYPHEVPVALGEFLRVLKPDGFAIITWGTLQAAGFKAVGTLARAPSFDLWAIASKSERTGAELNELAAAHLPG
jgi:ubiquinone/menaquinone biosynthesis C-methylase UbiE